MEEEKRSFTVNFLHQRPRKWYLWKVEERIQLTLAFIQHRNTPKKSFFYKLILLILTTQYNRQ